MVFEVDRTGTVVDAVKGIGSTVVEAVDVLVVADDGFLNGNDIGEGVANNNWRLEGRDSCVVFECEVKRRVLKEGVYFESVFQLTFINPKRAICVEQV